MRHYFVSKNVRLMAYVFSGEYPQSECLKRDESNGVYLFETRFLSWFYLHLVLSHMGFANVLLLRPLTRNHKLLQFMTPFLLPTLTLLLSIGFHRASTTGVACRQGTLTPTDTWSCTFGTCICSTCWDQSFSELVVILPDYALRISLGTFSILLVVFFNVKAQL